ncbi:hypothetical protein SAMN02800691_0397 [Luteibacter sp. UNCMF366Tsu5.1]|nr:hypothetical protein SAMN02800691_0397 [Luteibacter sp. UNCMF366Tsu5.1]
MPVPRARAASPVGASGSMWEPPWRREANEAVKPTPVAHQHHGPSRQVSLAAMAAPTVKNAATRYRCGSARSEKAKVGASLLAKSQRSGVATRQVPIASRLAPTGRFGDAMKQVGAAMAARGQRSGEAKTHGPPASRDLKASFPRRHGGSHSKKRRNKIPLRQCEKRKSKGGSQPAGEKPTKRFSGEVSSHRQQAGSHRQAPTVQKKAATGCPLRRCETSTSRIRP